MSAAAAETAGSVLPGKKKGEGRGGGRQKTPQVSVFVLLCEESKDVCTSKLVKWAPAVGAYGELKPGTQRLRCQYLYFCTSKASKLTQEAEELLARSASGVSICTFVVVKQVN